MDDNCPYAFIGFGAMDGNLAREFIGFGAMDGYLANEFIGFGAMDGHKTCIYIWQFLSCYGASFGSVHNFQL